MKINWNYIKGLFLLLLVGFLYGFSSQRNTQKHTHTIAIQFDKADNLFMNDAMVNKLLIQNEVSLKKRPKSMVNLHSLEKRVLAHPMVEDAVVFLSIDGTLQAIVKQRIPIARIQDVTDAYYLDRLGKKMPLSANYTARVPLVTGKIEDKDWKNVYFLITVIHTDTFLNKQIIGIHKNTNNEFELKTRVGNQTILVGSIENLKEKFKNLNFFYNTIKKNEDISKYTTLNLKYKNQVVCTKK